MGTLQPLEVKNYKTKQRCFEERKIRRLFVCTIMAHLHSMTVKRKNFGPAFYFMFKNFILRFSLSTILKIKDILFRKIFIITLFFSYFAVKHLLNVAITSKVRTVWSMTACHDIELELKKSPDLCN